MKTIFIAFSLKTSSVAEFFVELANQLSVKNKVFIITHSVEPHSFQLKKDVEILKWPSKRPTGIKDFIFLAKLVQKLKPEFMISNFAAVNIFLIVGSIYKVPQRIAWYHTLYAQLENNKLLKFRKSLIYQLASQVIANSNAAKTDLIKNFGVKGSKIRVINNALKDKNINRIRNTEKIVYAGRLDSVKGVKTLIIAMTEVRKYFPEVLLHIIGDDKTGNEAEELKTLVKELQLENNIIFQGNRSRDQVFEEFSSSCFTVVPSHVEAFGYVVIESFSVGTPVIGSNTTGIAEILRDKVDGFLFEVGDSADLSEKMLFLLRDEKRRIDMGHNCRKRFLEKYELSKAISNLQVNLNIN